MFKILKYTISSNDRISDVVKRAGGYTDSAFVFGAALYRESAKKLEKECADRTYQNIIEFLASDPGTNYQGHHFYRFAK